VKGISQADSKDLAKAIPLFELKDKTLVRIYQNPVKVTHIFLITPKNELLFSGYVGWLHGEELKTAIQEIRANFA
jgi:hypothetical protein